MQTWAQVFTRTRSGRVIQWCHNRNPRSETGLGRANDVTHRKRARRIWGIWKKSVNWVPASERESVVLAPEEDGWLSELAEGLQRVCTGWWWGRRADGKVSIERLCLSFPYVEKPFYSKVIKSFVPELRSRQVFFVFRDSYVIYICALWTLWTFCIPVWICLFHIFVYGYVTKGVKTIKSHKNIKKSFMGTEQRWWMLFWTKPGSCTQWNRSCTSLISHLADLPNRTNITCWTLLVMYKWIKFQH